MARRWYLGVYPARTPKGVRLTGIARNSPAWNAGLESGDYILDAGGFMVGEYEGDYYPLEQALDLGAGPQGWIELMVWNKRTFAEETLWVQLRARRR